MKEKPKIWNPNLDNGPLSQLSGMGPAWQTLRKSFMEGLKSTMQGMGYAAVGSTLQMILHTASNTLTTTSRESWACFFLWFRSESPLKMTEDFFLKKTGRSFPWLQKFPEEQSWICQIGSTRKCFQEERKGRRDQPSRKKIRDLTAFSIKTSLTWSMRTRRLTHFTALGLKEGKINSD